MVTYNEVCGFNILNVINFYSAFLVAGTETMILQLQDNYSIE